MDNVTLAIFGTTILVAISAGGLSYVLFFPYLSGEKKADDRKRVFRQQKTKRPARVSEHDKRRKQIEASMKRLEDRKKGKEKVNTSIRIQRAGLRTKPLAFYLYSLAFGLALGLGGLSLGVPPLVALGIAFAGAFGLPRWVLNFLRNRRERKFLEEFPNTIDVIVRGVKSGLPLNDCLAMIAAEAPDPVGPEFQEIVEAQRLGVPLDQGLSRLYMRVPLTEVNFLAIVLGIQAKSGGNLSEALGNLSHVLRDRKKMKAKIRAVSQEAKSGAMIIGSMPLIIVLIVNVITPDYMTVMFTTTLGHILLTGSVIWMSLGVLVMKKMINFDF